MQPAFQQVMSEIIIEDGYVTENRLAPSEGGPTPQQSPQQPKWKEGRIFNEHYQRSYRQSPKVVIYGPEGIGKTSIIASQFPNPVFIDTEGSTNNMDVGRMDKTVKLVDLDATNRFREASNAMPNHRNRYSGLGRAALY